MAKQLQSHPLASRWPVLSATIDWLVEDIKKRGLLTPIVLFEGKILDGQTRYTSCQKAGVSPRYETYTGDDPMGYALALNLGRRHATPSQKAMVAVAYVDWDNQGGAPRKARKGVSLSRDEPTTGVVGYLTKAAAEVAFGVSDVTIDRARQVCLHGGADLIRMVEQGETSVADAAGIVDSKRRAARAAEIAAEKAVKERADEAARKAKAAGDEAARKAKAAGDNEKAARNAVKREAEAEAARIKEIEDIETKRLAEEAAALAGFPQDVLDEAAAERAAWNGKGRQKTLVSLCRDIMATRERERAQEAALASRPAIVGDRYRLIVGDMTTTTEIEPESVDVVITDPPYPRESLGLFGHLARRSAEWLKPGGSLLVMTGQIMLPEVLAELCSSDLVYRWTLAYMVDTGPASQIFTRHIIQHWKPVFWFTKGDLSIHHPTGGNSYKLPFISDKLQSDANDKRYHHWGQSESGMVRIIEAGSLPGHIILDPFCGGGATGVAALGLGRQFIGMDIEEKSVQLTASRLEKIGAEAG